jgi:hypothetical protein
MECWSSLFCVLAQTVQCLISGEPIPPWSYSWTTADPITSTNLCQTWCGGHNPRGHLLIITGTERWIVPRRPAINKSYFYIFHQDLPFHQKDPAVQQLWKMICQWCY